MGPKVNGRVALKQIDLVESVFLPGHTGGSSIQAQTGKKSLTYVVEQGVVEVKFEKNSFLVPCASIKVMHLL